MAWAIGRLEASFSEIRKTKGGADLSSKIRVLLQMCCAVLSSFSHVQLFATPRTVAHQASLSMGFSRQEYWNGLPCPPPGDLPNPGIKPVTLKSPALAGSFFTTSTTWEALALDVQKLICHETATSLQITKKLNEYQKVIYIYIPFHLSGETQKVK